MFINNAQYYVKSTITLTQSVGSTFSISSSFETGDELETGSDTVSVILRNGIQLERMEITATGGTATIVLRGIEPQATKTANVSFQKQWTDGTIMVVTALASDLLDIDEQNGVQIIASDINFSGSVEFTGPTRLPTFADTTARDAVYVSPVNGDKCVVVGTGEQVYSGGMWKTLDIGTPTPNASTTVSGSVEIGTTAESKAGTDVGGTGAYLSVLPSDIAKNAQSGTFVYTASTTGSDTYTASLTPTLTAYTTGMTVTVKFTTANTGACSINLDSLGAKSIKTRGGNDPSDGDISSGSIRNLVYDGTNFILDYNYATTSESGSVEMATDVEASTGTDQLRYINPKQAKDNYAKYFDVITFTRVGDAASGTVSYSHSLGVVPKFIVFEGVGNTATVISHGAAKGTSSGSNSFVRYLSGFNGTSGSGACCVYTQGGSPENYQSGYVSAWDSSSFTINWTKNNSPTGTSNLMVFVAKLYS